MSVPATCEFCDVLAGRAAGPPLAFSDASATVMIGRRQPTGPGYSLVVARRHVAGVAGLDDEELVTLWRTVGRVQAAILETFGATGTTLLVNEGPPGQRVGHLDVHVVPRRVGDGYPCSIDDDVADAELAVQAERLGAALRAPAGSDGHG